MNKEHVEKRGEIEKYLNSKKSPEEISKILALPLGTRYIKNSVKWYIYCIRAKENQKKAIEKYPDLYSQAGKIAQKKHPEIGKNLGKKYGPIFGKINAERKKGNSEFFSKMAKRLQEINPNQSRDNMRKAHETLKRKGKFVEHQKLAAMKCIEKNPNQLKEMSKRAHEKYPLALLALESRRKNYPYKFRDCFFDSNDEKIICQKLVENNLIENPAENINIHIRIQRCHIDFFIKNKIFLEYHPPRKFGRMIETEEGYYQKRRELLDKNGFKEIPLIVISSLSEADSKINEIRNLIQSL